MFCLISFLGLVIMEKQNFFLIVLLTASLLDLVIPFFLGLKYPNYNSLLNTISSLGTKISPVSTLARTNLIIVGILFIVFAFGQRTFFIDIDWSTKLYFVGIFAFAIGCILAGIFPEDPENTPETISGKIHGITSGLGFLLLIFCPLWAIFIDDFGNIIINILFFVLGFLSFSLFLTSERAAAGFLSFSGLFQRLNLAILYGSLIFNYTNLIKN